MDTDIRKKKPMKNKATSEYWLRITELYWGRPRARISKLTVRIIALNAASILVLLIGFAAFIPYQENITNTKLEAFSRLAITGAIAIDENPSTKNIEKVAKITKAKIGIFDKNAHLLSQTENIFREAQTKSTAQTAIGFLISSVQSIYGQSNSLKDWKRFENPEVKKALSGDISLSIWRAPEVVGNGILLSVALPLKDGNAALFIRSGDDIEQEITQFWVRLLQIFGAILTLTIIVSIYIAGTIARPLYRLSNAARKVAIGQESADSIPDLSYRGDEVGELSTALRAMTSALSKRIDSNSKFAAEVSHELKNPLASIKSALETLDTLDRNSSKNKETLMQIMRSDIKRMNNRITNISRSCRLEATLSHERFHKINLLDLLPQAENNCTKTPYIMGQGEQLTQVFENIISNAHSFSENVTTSISSDDKNFTIKIKDDGKGIKDGEETKIFERFYTSRDGSDDHCGLGLSIALQIIKAHGGNIIAKNHKDGAVFIITLPTLY